MLAEHEMLAREAAAGNESYETYLLRLTEAEVASRSANAVAGRIRAAAFPVLKDFDAFDLTVKLLESWAAPGLKRIPRMPRSRYGRTRRLSPRPPRRTRL
jgi:hypothetical protein